MDALKESLLGKSTVTRRKAAIEIRKNGLDGYADALLEALKLEYDKNHWDTETEIIDTLGNKGNADARDYIKEKYVDNEYFLTPSVRAYVRLNRSGETDVTDIIHYLKLNKLAITEGVLHILGYDRIIPAIEDQDTILSLSWDAGSDRQKGFTDPRYGLAAACAGWTSEKTVPFLEHCLASGDVPLKYVAENSLKRKYVKLR